MYLVYSAIIENAEQVKTESLYDKQQTLNPQLFIMLVTNFTNTAFITSS